MALPHEIGVRFMIVLLGLPELTSEPENGSSSAPSLVQDTLEVDRGRSFSVKVICMASISHMIICGVLPESIFPYNSDASNGVQQHGYQRQAETPERR